MKKSELKRIIKETVQKLNEAKEMSAKDIKIIADFTSTNNHNASREHAAMVLKNKKLANSYGAIKTLHMYFQELTPELSSVRRNLDKHLYAQLKNKFSNSDEIMSAM